MAIGLAAPVSADYVLDGEFYSKDGIATFYVFDVYAKGTASTLGDTLPDRLAALDGPSDALPYESTSGRENRADAWQYQHLPTRCVQFQ